MYQRVKPIRGGVPASVLIHTLARTPPNCHPAAPLGGPGIRDRHAARLQHISFDDGNLHHCLRLPIPTHRLPCASIPDQIRRSARRLMSAPAKQATVIATRRSTITAPRLARTEFALTLRWRDWIRTCGEEPKVCRLSLLEGNGFELPVPQPAGVRAVRQRGISRPLPRP